MTQTIVNLGTGGAVLNARNGSTTGADSNDALFLDWDGENYVYLPGVVGNYLSVPDEAALDITGDIDIRVQVAMDDWTPGATQTLAGKWLPGVSQRSYIFQAEASGLLSFSWSADGSASISKSSTVATGLTDGNVKWVRVTLDVDNGSAQNEVKFWLSDDNITYTQLGSTVTTATATSIYSGTAAATVGARADTAQAAAGKFYRAQVFNGIDGTKVLDIDTSVLTTGAATSFTALTGQTVTINRSTAGRKAVAVVSPCWLFGTDDYMEVADNDLLDFGASDSFTVLAVVRQWATQGNFKRYLSKATNFDQGYTFAHSNSAGIGAFYVDDGPTNLTRQITLNAGSVCVVAGVVNRTAQTLVGFSNGVATASTSTSSLGSLTNSLAMRIGRDAASAEFSDMELLAVAVFRRALTATEITTITAYYQARLS